MMKRFVFLFALQACPQLSFGQENFDSWFQERINTVLSEAAVDLNSNDPRRQREATATDLNGTSVVDQSASSDFVSLAMSLLRPGASEGNSTQTVTVSAYSMLALAEGTSLTDPNFYRTHTDARRIFLTLGNEASTLEHDNTERNATVVGLKYLLWNERDLFASGNQERLAAITNALRTTALARRTIQDAMQRRIFERTNPQDFTGGEPNPAIFGLAFGDNFGTTWGRLSPEEQQVLQTEIEEFLADSLDPFRQVRDAIATAQENIRNRAQFAIAYTAKLRKNPGYRDHALNFIYDHGLTEHISWTWNFNAFVTDRRAAQLNSSHGFRAATEFLRQIGRPSELWGRTPMSLSAGGYARWDTERDFKWSVQGKLTIPIATGIDLPVMYRYGNHRESDGADAETRFAITIDTGRLGRLFIR